MKHPSESALALYSGGDSHRMAGLWIRLHLRGCAACSAIVASYGESCDLLRVEQSQIPAGLDWNRLVGEMTGNIHVGLAAGECVAPHHPKRYVAPWKPVLVASALALVVFGGMWLNFPEAQRESLARGLERVWNRDARLPAAMDPGIYLESTRNGIQVKENGAALTMMHPDVAPAVISISTQGSVRARYIDADTGQVTITNVYSQ